MEAPIQRSLLVAIPCNFRDSVSGFTARGDLWVANSETGHEAGFLFIVLGSDFPQNFNGLNTI